MTADSQATLDYAQIPLLDHGYLQLIEVWGSDKRIVEAARMSTDKGFLGWGGPRCDTCGFQTDENWVKKPCPSAPCPGVVKAWGDEHLLEYLYNNKHATPFEMAGAVFEIKAPIMVFREWHRHRTQSYNEMSARYIPLPNENYMPNELRLLQRPGGQGVNRQAMGVSAVDAGRQQAWRASLQRYYDEGQSLYEEGLACGVPKELARLAVTVGRYSKMRAAANLRNWLAFLTLRADKKAQLEIRVYANAVAETLGHLFPRTMALWAKERS